MKSLYAILFSLSLFSISYVQAQSPGGVGTTDLNLWLRADRGISTTNNGDLFTTWEDQSPQGNHAVQTNPTAQPIYKSRQMNQSPALRINQSQRFMNVPLEGIEDGVFTFVADSDAHIVRGLIALLYAAYNNKKCEEIAQIDIEAAFSEIGLNQHLSPSRRNGFFAMVERIQNLSATAGSSARQA